MRIPLSWLRDFVDVPWSAQELGSRLTMSGFELEALETAAPAFTGVVVAEIVEAVSHPQADKLQVCKVRAGGCELLQIVCGAANARVGSQDRAGHRRRQTTGRQGHHGGEAARRRFLRHVVFGEGAGAGRHFRGHRGAAGRRAGGHRTCAPTCSSTTRSSSSTSRRIAAMPCRCSASRAKLAALARQPVGADAADGSRQPLDRRHLSR